MIDAIARVVRSAFTPRHHARKADLATIRKALLLCMEECSSATALRLRSKIAHAQSPQELWMLRNDAYQLISQRHDQAIAAERINGLIQVFEGCLEPKQIVRIK